MSIRTTVSLRAASRVGVSRYFRVARARTCNPTPVLIYLTKIHVFCHDMAPVISDQSERCLRVRTHDIRYSRLTCRLSFLFSSPSGCNYSRKQHETSAKPNGEREAALTRARRDMRYGKNGSTRFVHFFFL